MTIEREYLRVSHSSMSMFAEGCPRKFELNKLYLNPGRHREESFSASVGIALHLAYQNYLVTRDLEAATWVLIQKYPYHLEWEDVRSERTIEACIGVLDEMIEADDLQRYEIARIKKPDGTIVPAVEVPFELRFPDVILPDGRSIAYIGWIDVILRDVVQDIYGSKDIKTHRRFTSNDVAKYKFHGQQMPYGIVLEHMLGQPITEFEVGYIDCLIDLLEPKVEEYKFLKTQTEIQEWVTWALVQFRNLSTFMELNMFPRCSTGCLSFNRPCYYLDICESRDRDTIQTYLLGGEDPEEYEEPVWEPWVTAEIELTGA